MVNHMAVEPKKRGILPPMDGEHNGKPYEQMDDLGVPLKHPYIFVQHVFL